MKHLMLDIETLGTKSDAIILSVAAVWFEPNITHPGQTSTRRVCHFHCSIEEQIANGRQLDPDTAAWWFKQSPKAFVAMALGQVSAADDPGLTAEGMNALRGALEEAEHIWANDPDFDCTILRDAFSPQFIARWPFSKHRSVRTICAMFPGIKQEAYDFTNFTAHNALDDCCVQVRMVQLGCNRAREAGLTLF